jgi:outer membrane murein-binding lipoprotein Lpp
MFNKGKIEDLSSEILNLNSKINELSKFGAMDAVQVEKEIADLRATKTNLEQDVIVIQQQLKEVKNSLIETQEIAMLQEVGVYQYTSILDTSEGYSDKIAEIQAKIKERNVTNGGAITAAQGWTVNGSTSEGAKMIKEFSKLMLRAYNGEVDDALRTLKPYKLDAAIDRVNKVEVSIEKLGKTMSIAIDDDYHDLRISEIKLTADYLAMKEEEKERQKEEKLRLKEEEKAQREFEKEKEKLNKELSHHQAVLAKADETGNVQAAEEAKAKITEVQNGINGVEERAANIRTGYVYVISNIGSFGEQVLKIGLTRRLDPEERIQELSDASVPFKFDTHAIIFSADAVSLEKQLHQELESLRVNKVNARKEFFRVTPALVRALLTRLSTDGILSYKEEAEAPEWRISMNGFEK